MSPRWIRFLAIGLLGFLIQLAALGWLIARAGWPWLAATLASVELAVVHNFLWHARWTWRDRPGRAWLVHEISAGQRHGLARGQRRADDPVHRRAGCAAASRQRAGGRGDERGQFHDGRSMGVPRRAVGDGVPAAGARRRRGPVRRSPERVGALRGGDRTTSRACADVERAEGRRTGGDRGERRKRSRAVRHDQRLARLGLHPRRHGRSAAPAPSASRHAAAAGRRRLVARDRAHRRFAARVDPPRPPRDRDGDLRHRARDALSPLVAAAGDGAQRRHADRRGGRQRSRVPVAAALVLALRRDERWRLGGAGVADAQPRRAVAHPPDRRAAGDAHRTGVHVQNA